MDNTLLIAVLVLAGINTLVALATAGAISKLIRYIEARDNEPVVGSVDETPERGLQTLQDERGDRWGRHMSYDTPNFDGITPRSNKNFDGVGEALIHRDEDE